MTFYEGAPTRAPQPQGGFFRAMAQRRYGKPGADVRQPPRLPPQTQPPMQPNQAPMGQPPAPMNAALPGAPGGMPGTGGGFGAAPPGGSAPQATQATASSADVNLGPNFQAERLKRLAMAQAQAASPGRFQY